ncbi:MAG: hypothetical protein GYA21_06990 [Myxococcales bacterium]|nr:hypothetical protein [Myxococcales bacterium]
MTFATAKPPLLPQPCRWRRLLLPGPAVCLALLLLFPAALSHVQDFDIFFNLSQGRHILSQGFHAAEPFSPNADRPWFPHEWGFGVAAEAMASTLGAVGVKLLLALALALEVLLAWRLSASPQGGGGLLPLLGTSMVIWSQADVLLFERAYHFGNLLFLLSLLLVRQHLAGRGRALWWAPPLCAVWANLHASWIAGVALLGLSVTGKILDERRLARGNLAGLACTALSFLAAAASPEGWRTCLYPLGFWVRGSSADIQEWRSLTLDTPEGQAWLVAILLALGATLWARRVSFSRLLPAVFFSALAFRHERFSLLAVACLWVLLADLLPRPGETRTVPMTPAARALWRADHQVFAWSQRCGGHAWLGAGLIALVIHAALSPAPLIDRLDERVFPARALKALAQKPPGRVLNSYHLGGAVSYLAGPEFAVFIDGRNDPYPPAVHEAYRRLVLLEPGWEDVIARFSPRYVLWSTLVDGPRVPEALQRRGGFSVLVDDGDLGRLWEVANER